jgi:hypothetical protein
MIRSCSFDFATDSNPSIYKILIECVERGDLNATRDILNSNPYLAHQRDDVSTCTS